MLLGYIGTSVFVSLDDHAVETEAISNHQVQLIRTIAKCYVNLRLHQCKSYTPFVQGESCRSVLGKTILFKRAITITLLCVISTSYIQDYFPHHR